LAFAKQAGAVPPDATKKSHKAIRELFKTCALGVLYGMGSQSLAERLGQPPLVARNLLSAHRQVYRRFWQWSDSVVDCAVLTGELTTVFGWNVHVRAGFNPRSLRNFPMQGNGAEMLRLGCCLASERGIEICAPIHDAVLIFASVDRVGEAVVTTRAAMAEASKVVLAGFEIRTDFDPETSIITWPNRYVDERGAVMWETVNKLLARVRVPV
jgi:DNA polymerase I-like protein with 3'-5' exonuclease and polymerase domains